MRAATLSRSSLTSIWAFASPPTRTAMSTRSACSPRARRPRLRLCRCPSHRWPPRLLPSPRRSHRRSPRPRSRRSSLRSERQRCPCLQRRLAADGSRRAHVLPPRGASRSATEAHHGRPRHGAREAAVSAPRPAGPATAGTRVHVRAPTARASTRLHRRPPRAVATISPVKATPDALPDRVQRIAPAGAPRDAVRPRHERLPSRAATGRQRSSTHRHRARGPRARSRGRGPGETQTCAYHP